MDYKTYDRLSALLRRAATTDNKTERDRIAYEIWATIVHGEQAAQYAPPASSAPAAYLVTSTTQKADGL